MIPGTTLARQLARLSLLIAVALHFASATAGPWAHLAPAAPGAAAVDPTGGEAPSRPEPHDELSCALCHWLVVLVVPSGGDAVPLPLFSAVADIAERPALLAAVARSRPSARAPPRA